MQEDWTRWDHEASLKNAGLGGESEEFAQHLLATGVNQAPFLAGEEKVVNNFNLVYYQFNND